MTPPSPLSQPPRGREFLVGRAGLIKQFASSFPLPSLLIPLVCTKSDQGSFGFLASLPTTTSDHLVAARPSLPCPRPRCHSSTAPLPSCTSKFAHPADPPTPVQRADQTQSSYPQPDVLRLQPDQPDPRRDRPLHARGLVRAVRPGQAVARIPDRGVPDTELAPGAVRRPPPEESLQLGGGGGQVPRQDAQGCGGEVGEG